MLTATAANITGTVTANAGAVGGFTIDSTEGLYAGTGATRVQMKAGAGFWAGATAQGSAPFRVGVDGHLTATDATITGDITADTLDANSGTIGGLDVDGTLTMNGGSIVAGAVSLSSSGLSAASGNVVVDADGLTLATGTSAYHRVKWSNGSFVAVSANIMSLVSSSGVNLEASGGVYVRYNGTAFLAGQGSTTLGESASPWSDLYLSTHGSVVSVLSDHESRIAALENP